jgi:hypothetical protein
MAGLMLIGFTDSARRPLSRRAAVAKAPVASDRSVDAGGLNRRACPAA